MLYHLLRAPVTNKDGVVQRTAQGQIIWELQCGAKVGMPPQKFAPGTVVKTPDAKGDVVVECPGCYNGQDEVRSDADIAQQKRLDEENATLDGDIGDAVEETDQTASVAETETLKEDDDPWGEEQVQS